VRARLKKGGPRHTIFLDTRSERIGAKTCNDNNEAIATVLKQHSERDCARSGFMLTMHAFQLPPSALREASKRSTAM